MVPPPLFLRYEYLEDCPTKRNRPAVWMPALTELIHDAHFHGMLNAIRKAKGSRDSIGRMARLVPHREWNYFESQRQLLIGLHDYIQQQRRQDTLTTTTRNNNNNNNTTTPEYTKKLDMIPPLNNIRQDDPALFRLIQRFGGRKFVAARYGLCIEVKSNSHCHSSKSLDPELTFGPFRLQFAIDLLDFVRQQEMQRRAPLVRPRILMPSREQCQRAGRHDLIEGIEQFGGFESVARRLGLGIDLVYDGGN